jgi:transglycosylase-like protein with SLT domain
VTTVPSAYVPLVTQAAQGTGLPYAVVAAQANEESGFQATATSPTGAMGWLQFEPSTYDSVASQAGVAAGTEDNPADETKAYIVYMNQLLKEEGGSIFKALEAYNAGPGNLQAGAGYATTIMATANTPTTAKAGSGNVSTTSALSGIPIIGSILDPAQGIINDILNGVLKGLGVGSIKDMVQRLGLILLGFALLIVGIHLLAGGQSSQPINVQTGSSTEPSGETTRTRTVKTPVSTHKTMLKTGAGDAVEAAAVA